MRIGELSKRTGASVRSLRHYEKAGLLRSRRLPNGYRAFDEDAAERVEQIRLLLATGLSIADIALLIPCFDEPSPGGSLCLQARERYRQKLKSIDRKIDTLQQIRHRIVELLPPEEDLP